MSRFILYIKELCLRAKVKNYSKKNKAKSIAVKDTNRSNHVSRDSKQGKNKEINHKEPF